MVGVVDHLEPVMPYRELGSHNVEHPMRVITRDAVALGGWSPETAGDVGAIFDSMAAEWHHKHSGSAHDASLVDALDRGCLPDGRLVELGCGTGIGTAVVAQRRRVSAALDLSRGMLANADPSVAPLVRADASILPLPDGCVEVLLLLNMLLFSAEAARVLAPHGALVWVNSSGEATPIHLTAEEVVEALPGHWNALASRAGTGTWCVAQRARQDS